MTQYGFRPVKSTAHAIFIIRRIQDFAEQKRSTAVQDAPRLGKTFDEIDHGCLGEAVERMGIEQGIIETPEDGYSKAVFFVEDEFGKSEKNSNTQESGKAAHCHPICLS